MNLIAFRIYDAAAKDLLRLKASIGEKEFTAYGYAAELEEYRVKAHLALHESEMPFLYIEGHSARRGYAVLVEYSDAPPVRYYSNLRRARAIVERFNRLQVRKNGARNEI